MKTFGGAIAIQTKGPDAVEDFEETLLEAKDRVSQSIVEQMKALVLLGYRVDAGTVAVVEEQREETYTILWKMRAEQTVPMWRRVWKAVRA